MRVTNKRHGPRPTPIAERFWIKVDKNGPIPTHCPELGCCWMWTAARSAGYGVLGVSVPTTDGRMARRMEKAHRVSWELAYGRISKGRDILHRCDNPPCVRPEHLQEGTHAENMKHMFSRGRRPCPGRLNVEQVQRLREAYFSDPMISTAGLAGEYGLARETIRLILLGKLYARFPGPTGPVRPHRGSVVHTAKLTDELAKTIILKFRKGRQSPKRIAADHGVSAQIVRGVLAGRFWRHVWKALRMKPRPLAPPRVWGSRVKRAKLTEELVATIRQRAAEGESAILLAHAYGCGANAIRQVIRRDTWKHVP